MADRVPKHLARTGQVRRRSSRHENTLRGLTVSQPWATLIAIGAKRVETRAWPTRYRGTIAIHAAKGLRGIFSGARDEDLEALCFQEPFAAALAEQDTADLPRGAIIATAELVDVVPVENITSVRRKGFARLPYEYAFGDYAPGRFGWLLENVQPLTEPVPYRGALGLWPVAAHAHRAIERALRETEPDALSSRQGTGTL